MEGRRTSIVCKADGVGPPGVHEEETLGAGEVLRVCVVLEDAEADLGGEVGVGIGRSHELRI